MLRFHRTLLNEHTCRSVGDKQGLQMALGNMDINTMEQMDDFNPDAPVTQVKFNHILLLLFLNCYLILIFFVFIIV